ncbi:hypothetical protein BD770DRAFT_443466 [Pilaira anomala]|nr:hypothetical protein BD770DRAFT_443466 [Pilaira anomala]
MSAQNQNKSKPSQKGAKNKRNKDAFKSDAQRRLLEIFSPEISVTFSSNVEAEVVFDVINRFDEVYLQHVRCHSTVSNWKYEEDVLIDTKLVSRCAFLKKLIISTSPSNQSKVRRYQEITNALDLHTPSFMFTIIDTFGETNDANLIIRSKNIVFTIHSLALDIAKTFLDHSENKYRYNANQKGFFNSLEFNTTHFGDEASTEKLRLIAGKRLALYCTNSFEVTLKDEDGNANLCYPRLEVSDNFETTITNFIAWTLKLNYTLPDIMNVLYWGILTFAQTYWFREPNLKLQIRQLIPELAECLNVDITPEGLLSYMGWKVIYYNDYSHDNMLISLVTDAYIHIYLNSDINLSRIFNLTEQPLNPFGTQAQLIWHYWSSSVPKRSISQDGDYQGLRSASTGTSLIDIKDKGDLIFGLNGIVEYFQSYGSRVDSRLKAFRSACASDFK